MNHSVLSKIVLIGASTGGPGQIQQIITSLPLLENTTIIIAQHMVKGFIPSFAKRLKDHTSNNVVMAEDNKILESGNIYICSGHTKVINNNSELHFTYTPSKENHYNPDIDVLFHSVVPLTNKIETIGVILTGIGEDGVNGCRELSLNGCRCLTETEQSAIVDGMPSRARKIVPNIQVLNMREITSEIEEFCD